MIVVDANVVVAAFRGDHPHHSHAREWLERVVDGDEPVAVPSTVWMSFVRIVTSNRIFEVPSAVDEAFEFARAVSRQRAYQHVAPGRRHLSMFEQQCETGAASGNLVNDAWIAAIAQENGASVVSFDRDFARFPGLRWFVPGE